ncbi:hypothetical protein TUMEXPCC7403_10120 [Tumidithrix helvetica PCC 7403]|uniref:hypothetical protein n=1 Tax=Tumidithrix helvetica TaxID=3457545 RepID=UPI003CB95FF3
MVESHVSRFLSGCVPPLLMAFLGLVMSLAGCTESQRQNTAVTNAQPTPSAQSKPTPVESKAPDKPDLLAKFDRAEAERLTDTAKFIAGIKLEDKSKLARLTKSGAWIEYNKFFEEAWSKLESQQLSPIKKWSSTELKSLSQTSKPIFYPFAGPDFLYAYTFFPNANNYMLIGLEPVGKLPDLAALSDDEISQKLREMNGAMFSLLQFSFFQTKSMQVDLADKGTLPILFVFLARTNNQILAMEYVGMDKNGGLKTFPDGNIDEAYLKGAKITFVQAGKSEPQFLYYFAIDLSDEGFEATPALKNFVEKNLKESITYTKAASYLMHYENFSQIRDLVLAKSSAILQDDSGMPVRFFEPKQWNLQFYGTYTGPIALFAKEYQDDLRQIYETGSNVKALNFGIGYKYGLNESNLMLATKKN